MGDDKAVLYAIIDSEYFDTMMGYHQPLLILSYEEDWSKGQWTETFSDYMYSALDLFGLEEYIEDIFEPIKSPMTKEDLGIIAKSLGFKHEPKFGENYCELEI
jgi:hypothetical protein